jgi:hypothetical protein
VNRRAFLIVTLVAIVMLGAIGTSLVLLTNDADTDGNAEPAPGTASDPAAVRFDDPEGRYTLEIDPDWRVGPATGGVESWTVGPFADTVEIETETVVNTDLDQYLQLVYERAPDAVEDFRLREFRVLNTEPVPGDTSETPHQLGIIAYEGVQDGDALGHFLVASVEPGRAVVAWLTTDKERFDAARADVEPYLLTLRTG